MRISPLLTGRNQILPQSWWRIPLTDKSSIAGSEDAEPLAPPIKPIKPVTRNKAPQEPPVKKGRRSRRCGQCPGCQVPEDCGVCTNCLDKPKFGGRNIKKQCCKWVQVPPGGWPWPLAWPAAEKMPPKTQCACAESLRVAQWVAQLDFVLCYVWVALK